MVSAWAKLACMHWQHEVHLIYLPLMPEASDGSRKSFIPGDVPFSDADGPQIQNIMCSDPRVLDSNSQTTLIIKILLTDRFQDLISVKIHPPEVLAKMRAMTQHGKKCNIYSYKLSSRTETTG